MTRALVSAASPAAVCVYQTKCLGAGECRTGIYVYTALNEREQALVSVERAYAAHDRQMQYLSVDASFDPLRSDSRFQDLVLRARFKTATETRRHGEEE